MTSRFAKDVAPIESVTIGQSEVDVVDGAPNLSVVIDKNMSLTTHVNNLCRSTQDRTYFQIH